MNYHEAARSWQQDRPLWEQRGLSWEPGVEPRAYLPDGWGANFDMAMDAQLPLSTDPNSAIPSLLTTLIDPAIYEVVFSPTQAAAIYDEVRKGTWLEETAMFPIAEHTGEVASYGDYSENGSVGTNVNWPQRQSYPFQTIKEYGDRELARAGLGRINWVGEQDKAAAMTLNRFANIAYFFGVGGLQNYGWLNDPNLSASITPATKAAGGTAWVVGGKVVAQANEVYNDIQSLYLQLVSQTGGLVAQDTAMTLSMSPTSAVALTATNTFNVNVSTLLKQNFTRIRIMTAVQYGTTSAVNPQGIAAGNLVQLAADEVEGQDVGYCAFNEKMRAFPIIRRESSYRQKVMAGVWGAVIRMPFALASMVGV